MLAYPILCFSCLCELLPLGNIPAKTDSWTTAFSRMNGNQCFFGRPVLIFSSSLNARFNCVALSPAKAFRPARNTSLFFTCILAFRQIALISAIFWYSLCGIVKLSRTTFFLCSFFGFFAAGRGAFLTDGPAADFVIFFAGMAVFFIGAFFAGALAFFLVVMLSPWD